MKKVTKIVSAIAASAVLVGAAIVPIAVSAWGDNTSNASARTAYTLEQVNAGALGNKITFNSITNGTIGDERNFVGARVADGNNGLANNWNANSIEVEEGKTYLVRIYVHNNNRDGESAIARNVKTTFALSKNTSTQNTVTGYIDSSNATPSQYWDSVTFTSNRNFYLDYVEGSALLENNGVGANGGVKLSDSIITSTGATIGYKSLNGEIPGCFEYASYVTIKVKPVFENTNDYTVEKTVRKTGSKTWQESVNANVGETVEYQIHYKNISGKNVRNVMVKDVLPTNMQIVSDIMLYNATNPNGIKQNGDIITTGINIGGYDDQGDAYIRFTAKVIDNNLICGKNTLRNWGQVGVGTTTLQDDADVVVQKTCAPTETPSTPSTTVPENKFPNDTPTYTPAAMPSTGPAAVATGVIGAGSVVTAAGYYVASRKKLNR